MHTQPVEDIDAVLGRFQAWAGMPNAIEVKPGIRELSYDEALQSSRSRRQGPDKAAAKIRSGSEKAAAPVATPAASAELKRGKTPPVRLGDTRRGDAGGADAQSHNDRSRDAGRTAVKKRQARTHADRVAPARRADSTSPARTAGGEGRPAFGEVLAETVRTAAIRAPQPAEIARLAALSIRLAPAERALIQTRAAEAGVTASAYMRQCVLEVEQMRAEFRRRLTALECEAATASPASVAPISVPGFFARLAQRVFPRRSHALALRA